MTFRVEIEQHGLVCDTDFGGGFEQLLEAAFVVATVTTSTGWLGRVGSSLAILKSNLITGRNPVRGRSEGGLGTTPCLSAGCRSLGPVLATNRKK